MAGSATRATTHRGGRTLMLRARRTRLLRSTRTRQHETQDAVLHLRCGQLEARALAAQAAWLRLRDAGLRLPRGSRAGRAGRADMSDNDFTVTADELDRCLDRAERAEALLRQIRDGKHSLPGTLVQIDRYFADATRAAALGNEDRPA